MKISQPRLLPRAMSGAAALQQLGSGVMAMAPITTEGSVDAQGKKSEQELKEEEMDLFTKYYSEWKGGRKNTNEFYKTIPRFYYRLPAEDEVLLQKLREESRAVFLQRKSRELLDNEELQNLWFLLDKHQIPPVIGEEAMINYENFLKVGEKAGPKCKQFFTAKVFAKLLHTDSYGRISIMQFFNYVMRKGQYLNLDKDHNGMLSKEELSRYGTATMTNVFLDRVFQECLTYDGEMDYKTYLDFVLALENRKEPAALQYIFKLLDIENKGYLNVFSLNYFFRDEIFDMVKPKDPLKISLQDLINSNQGDTVTTILIDLNGFWTYENREALVANDNENSADLDDT
ncbi:hypothetical protein NN561_000132 [Cricetulus griseus]